MSGFGDEIHVFLSYSRDDISIMRRVRDDLLDAGLKVWVDEEIRPGTPIWFEAIENAIGKAVCCVVILSPKAKNSRWIINELILASNDNKPIFPILAKGDVQTAIPFPLLATQHIDIRDASRYKQEITDLANAIRYYVGFTPTVYQTTKPVTAPLKLTDMSKKSITMIPPPPIKLFLGALGFLLALVVLILLIYFIFFRNSGTPFPALNEITSTSTATPSPTEAITPDDTPDAAELLRQTQNARITASVTLRPTVFTTAVTTSTSTYTATPMSTPTLRPDSEATLRAALTQTALALTPRSP